MLETLLLALELLVRTGALAALLLLREARLCCRKLSMIETSSWASASLASMICTIRSGFFCSISMILRSLTI